MIGGGVGSGFDRYRELGRDQGLAAGVAAVLDGLDPATVAPQRLAVLPAAGLPADVRVVPNPLAADEGLAVVRFPAKATGSALGPGLTNRRAAALAAVRIGVLGRVLDQALERLSGRTFAGVPLLEQQMVTGSIADVVTEVELSTETLGDGAAPAEVASEHHEQLTEAGWTVARFFGAEGYLAGHPVRSLYVSTLVADVWIPRSASVASEE